MDTLVHANIFFYISSIGFIVIFIIFTIIGIYLISIISNIHRVVKRIRRDIETIGDTAKELVEELYDNSFFSLFFRKKKKYNKK